MTLPQQKMQEIEVCIGAPYLPLEGGCANSKHQSLTRFQQLLLLENLGIIHVDFDSLSDRYLIQNGGHHLNSLDLFNPVLKHISHL